MRHTIGDRETYTYGCLFNVDAYYSIFEVNENAAGQKRYIQTKMAEYADKLWELMQKPRKFKGLAYGRSRLQVLAL